MSQKSAVREISPEEVHAAVERGDVLRLVDVRQPWEYESHRIAGALLLPLGDLPGAVQHRDQAMLPLGDLPRRAAALDPAEAVICICEHGVRSRHAADFLAALGFSNVATMTGGMAQYLGPVETGAGKA